MMKKNIKMDRMKFIEESDPAYLTSEEKKLQSQMKRQTHDALIEKGEVKVKEALFEYSSANVRIICNRIARKISFKLSREKEIARLRRELGTLEAKK